MLRASLASCKPDKEVHTKQWSQKLSVWTKTCKLGSITKAQHMIVHFLYQLPSKNCFSCPEARNTVKIQKIEENINKTNFTLLKCTVPLFSSNGLTKSLSPMETPPEVIRISIPDDKALSKIFSSSSSSSLAIPRSITLHCCCMAAASIIARFESLICRNDKPSVDLYLSHADIYELYKPKWRNQSTLTQVQS